MSEEKAPYPQNEGVPTEPHELSDEEYPSEDATRYKKKPTEPLPPEVRVVMETPPALTNSKHLRREMARANQIDLVLLGQTYISVYEELVSYLERAKKGKIREVYNRKTKTWREEWQPNEEHIITGVREMRQLLDSLVSVKLKIKDEGVAIPSHLVEMLQKALEPYPEAKKAVLKAIDGSDD